MGSGVYTNVADEGHMIKNSNVTFSSVEMSTRRLRLLPYSDEPYQWLNVD